MDRATCVARVPEVYDPATNTWTQLTAAELLMPLYPFMFQLPDGRVLYAGSNEAKYYYPDSGCCYSDLGSD